MKCYRQILLVLSAPLWVTTAQAQLKVGSNPTSMGANANLEAEAANGTKTVIQKSDGKMGVGTASPTAQLHVSRTETTATNGTNIHGIRTDVNVTGASGFNDDVNGYWADVRSDGGISVNGVFVHATHTGSNTLATAAMPLVSGTYGEAQVQNASSAYNAIGAAGMAESTQTGSNTGLNGVGRNAAKLNIGVNAIANATDLNIATRFTSKLLLPSFSAAVAAYNAASGTYDFALYAEGSKNYLEGNLGIGIKNPTEKLYVQGNTYVSGLISSPSDARFKENIQPLNGSLANILKLRGVSYTHKPEFMTSHALKEGIQIGFIAQEIEKTFPQFVLTQADGYKAVDYARLTPVLVEAIKEQQKQIDELRLLILELKTQNKTTEMAKNKE
jgi:hypothetical protein